MSAARWGREMVGLFVACVIYLPTLLWHKAGVWIMGVWLNHRLAGTGVSVPWHRLVFHDWVKFLPFSEYLPYARHWYATNLKANFVGRVVGMTPLPRWFPVECPDGVWAKALTHHTNRMDHHLSYYRGPDLGLWKRRGTPPDDAVVEILADKMGAQWGYNGKWPEVASWTRLAPGFDEEAWPTKRSKALYFGICCAAGFGPCFTAADVKYGWGDVRGELGAGLTDALQAKARLAG